jgi:hypothetical protein
MKYECYIILFILCEKVPIKSLTSSSRDTDIPIYIYIHIYTCEIYKNVYICKFIGVYVHIYPFPINSVREG